MGKYDPSLTESAPVNALAEIILWLREEKTHSVIGEFEDCRLEIVLKEK